MTAKALLQYVGRKGSLQVGSLRFPIIIRDAREVFGRLDFLVWAESDTGSGHPGEWVAASRVYLAEEV